MGKKGVILDLGLKLFDIRRIALELVASVFIAWLIISLLGRGVEFDHYLFRGALFVVTILIALCEGIFIFDAFISRYYPWHTAVRKRVMALFLFAMVWQWLVVVLSTRLAPLLLRVPDRKVVDGDVDVAVVIVLLFAVIYVVGLIGYNYHETLNRFIMANERLEREKLELDYLSLQDQLKPHFLFNNMSTLIALISENTGKALNFASNFTDVYRYVLMSSRQKLVLLEDELKFITSYIAIHQERLGDGLLVSYNIAEVDLQRKVPSLSLQFLVENAIKHNIASSSEPLLIEISVKAHVLIVRNNLRPKLSTYSTNTGLRNLKRRIQFLAPDKDLIIRDTFDSFIVKVPTFD